MRVDSWTIFTLLKPHSKTVFLIIALQAVGAFAQVEAITLLKPLLNEGVYGNDMDVLAFMALALLALTLIIAGVLIATTILASRVATSVSESLRVDIMKATVGVEDLRDLGSSPTDAMVCLINDVASVQAFTFEVLRTYVPMPILLILLFIYTFLANVAIGVFMIFTVIVVAILTYLFTARIRPLYAKQVEYMGDINSGLREKVLGARTIRAYAGYDYEVKKFYERSGRLGKINDKITMYSYYIPNIATACMWLFIVFIFVASALEEGTSLNASEIIIFMQFATTMVATLALVPFICVDAPKASVCYRHIKALIRKSKEVERTYPDEAVIEDTEHCLSTQGAVVKDRFGGIGLDNLDLTIDKGKTVTLLGPNGCGISHLINMMLGFNIPDSGKVLVNGMDVSKTDPALIRNTVSYADNSLHILRGTVRFNLDPRGLYTDEEIMELCNRIGLGDYISSLYDGLDTPIHHSVSSMSGGQKLLVIIARCLLKDAELYVFDDCLFSLDTATKAKVLETITDICRGKSVIYLMHDTSTCELSDEIILLSGGRVVARGDHEFLVTASEFYKDIYNTGQGRSGTWA